MTTFSAPLQIQCFRNVRPHLEKRVPKFVLPNVGQRLPQLVRCNTLANYAGGTAASGTATTARSTGPVAGRAPRADSGERRADSLADSGFASIYPVAQLGTSCYTHHPISNTCHAEFFVTILAPSFTRNAVVRYGRMQKAIQLPEVPGHACGWSARSGNPRESKPRCKRR